MRNNTVRAGTGTADWLRRIRQLHLWRLGIVATLRTRNSWHRHVQNCNKRTTDSLGPQRVFRCRLSPRKLPRRTTNTSWPPLTGSLERIYARDLNHSGAIGSLINIKSDEARRIAANIAKLPGCSAKTKASRQLLAKPRGQFTSFLDRCMLGKPAHISAMKSPHSSSTISSSYSPIPRAHRSR